MDSQDTLTHSDGSRRPSTPDRSVQVPALVLAWSRHELDRIGEVVLPDARPRVLGRAAETDAGEPEPLELIRQRPAVNARTGPLQTRRVSRRQLLVWREGDRLHLRNIGRVALRVGGGEVAETTLAPGDVAHVGGTVWLCTWRPERMLALAAGVRLGHHPFGRADPHGLVGESPAMWALRGRIAFAGPRGEHVLVTGPSGAGKELVARALHATSGRAGRDLVARNAATLPESLVDAELFGNAPGYPNVGMQGRPGLVGAADGSTLFLDEIGEVPVPAQAHLLRVLDDGEYQRLGDATVRRSDLRLVAATNRSEAALKHDLAARLTLRIAVPGLEDRVEDVPLLAVHLLREIAATEADIARRFFDGPWPRLSPELVAALLERAWTAQVRELRNLLWAAIAESKGDTLSEDGLPAPTRRAAADPSGVPQGDPEAVRVQAALDRNNGNQEATWRELGMANRYELRRAIRRHGLVVRRSF